MRGRYELPENPKHSVVVASAEYEGSERAIKLASQSLEQALKAREDSRERLGKVLRLTHATYPVTVSELQRLTGLSRPRVMTMLKEVRD